MSEYLIIAVVSLVTSFQISSAQVPDKSPFESFDSSWYATRGSHDICYVLISTAIISNGLGFKKLFGVFKARFKDRNWVVQIKKYPEN